MVTNESEAPSLEEGQALVRKTMIYLILWVLIIVLAGVVLYFVGDPLMDLVV
ncbi:hypothetical protein [Natrialbaceae archaeon AArc-T1-2]|uniref:hypothetical protein n=1 Tax=Natrialbaceae archaeon AArc-T1-2 TaxID=3053904 RepID=UPI00255B0897|nr:hypothetical protein [Natrialbaceae archaeon AArc-T1-2]WIV68077.1 hypothetical protein QQ977_04935 [Natrialbaceae archaeon AArc-T1-2]